MVGAVIAVVVVAVVVVLLLLLLLPSLLSLSSRTDDAKYCMCVFDSNIRSFGRLLGDWHNGKRVTTLEARTVRWNYFAREFGVSISCIPSLCRSIPF